MNKETEELQKRIAGLTDEELLQMVTVEASEYRQEAIDFAKAELTARGIDFTQVEKEAGAPGETLPVDPVLQSRRSSIAVCRGCGGRLRSGTLVAERELTIVFSDNREERFVRVTACTQCGEVALVADFETEITP